MPRRHDLLGQELRYEPIPIEASDNSNRILVGAFVECPKCGAPPWRFCARLRDGKFDGIHHVRYSAGGKLSVADQLQAPDVEHRLVYGGR